MGCPLIIMCISFFVCFEMLAQCCPCIFGSPQPAGGLQEPLVEPPMYAPAPVQPQMSVQGDVPLNGVMIPQAIAQRFFDACNDEYLQGQGGAVGNFFDENGAQLDQSVGEALQ